MAGDLTHERRARRYLQASMESGYTGLPAEHRRAKQDLMRQHERAYPRVREHALAGTSKHFDRALSPGEREHQAHLREQEGLSHADVLRLRKELDEAGGGGPTTPPRKRSSPRSSNSGATAGPRAAASAAGAAGDALDSITGQDTGNLFLYIAGTGVLLILAYLLVSSKGSKALIGLVPLGVGAVKSIVDATDPITELEKKLDLKPLGGAISGGAGGSGGGAGGGNAPSPLGGAAERSNAPFQNVSGSAPPQKGGTKAEKQYVAQISKAEGWSASAWEAIIELESGWNPKATNASSGAFGIGQFLGSTKTEYSKYGSESTDPLKQIGAMAVYIKKRYGDPTAALAFHRANGWY